jgi:hypothetical protein
MMQGHSRWIPPGVAGTRFTLEHMRAMAWDAQSLQDALEIARPRDLDGFLRRRWRYVPDGIWERVRPVDENLFNLLGDCDDAAVIAAAVLLHYWIFTMGDRPAALVRGVAIVAGRPPQAVDFAHVWVVGTDGNGEFRIDPTAPSTSYFDNRWEFMRVELV